MKNLSKKSKFHHSDDKGEFSTFGKKALRKERSDHEESGAPEKSSNENCQDSDLVIKEELDVKVRPMTSSTNGKKPGAVENIETERNGEVDAFNIKNENGVKREQSENPNFVRKKRKYVRKKRIGGNENSSGFQENTRNEHDSVDDDEGEDNDDKRPKKKAKENPDEQLKCETCGQYGFASDFCASGRFCGQKCVGVYASRCRAQALAAASVGQGVDRKVDKPKRGKKRGRKPWKRSSIDLNEEDVLIPSKKNGYISKFKARRKPKQPGLPCDDSTVYYSAVTAGVEFEWDVYLALTGTEAVPEETFSLENPGRNLYLPPAGFKQGMKLEAFDPRHPSCLCVTSVVEVLGPRMRLHFDGWSESYDFWTNMDSPFLFPIGWADRNGQKLNPPRGIKKEDFQWDSYLEKMNSEAAPEELFAEVPPIVHKFGIGMKLEAVDRQNPDLTCVASVNNVVGQYILIHFDEWEDIYDYWARESCPHIHPIRWCKSNGVRLTPAQDDQVDTFDWDEYLQQTKSIPVPEDAFKQRPPPAFKIGNKLEVVDPRNPSLVRVATIAQVEEYSVQVHFDGWDAMFDYWMDSDSLDLHPVGWCKRTSHPLEAPPSPEEAQDTASCPTPGCKGIGHVKGAKYSSHHSIFGCPYSIHNVNRSSPLVDRLAENSMVEETSIAVKIYRKPIDPSSVTPECLTRSDSLKQRIPGRIVGRPAKRSDDGVLDKTSRLLATTKPGRIFSSFGKYRLKGAKGKLFKRKRTLQETGTNGIDDFPRTSTTSSLVSTVPISPNLTSFRLNTKIPSDKRPRDSRVLSWTVSDVVQFVKGIGLSDHAHCFEEQQVDGEALFLLSQADIVRIMGIKLGPALKIYHALNRL